MTRALAIQMLDDVQEQLASQDFAASVAAAGSVELMRESDDRLMVSIGPKVVAQVFYSADEPVPDADARLFIESNYLPETHSDQSVGGICTAVFGCASLSQFS